MKNLANLKLEVLSTEELMAVRGGEAPTDPIIIKKPGSAMLSLSLETEDSIK